MDIRQLKQDKADNDAALAALAVEMQGLLAVPFDKRDDVQKARISAIDVRRAELTERAATITKEIALQEKYLTEAVTKAPAVQVGEDNAAKKPFANLGEQLQAIHEARVGGHRGDAHARLMAAAQGAGEAIDSDGGYLLQPDFKNEIESRMFDQGAVLSRCRQIQCGPNSNSVTIKVTDETSRATGSRFGGVRGYWVNEGSAPTASKPTFSKVDLKLKKVAALGYASDELLEDATAMASIFPQAFAEELSFLAEDAVFNGTGAEQPKAIIGDASTVSITKETGQAASTIVYANIVKMWARMWARSRSNAVWFINQACEPQLYQMTLTVGTGGVPVYLPPGGLSAAPYASLMGRPVIPVEYAAALGTVGDIVLADLSQYGLLTKGGVKQASSMHVAFTTDEMAFRATYRVDGGSLWKSALTPFKGSDTLSPFVTLATRS